jgi:hypothetical protein
MDIRSIINIVLSDVRATTCLPTSMYFIRSTVYLAMSSIAHALLHVHVSTATRCPSPDVVFSTLYFNRESKNTVNPLTPNDTYSGRTATLTSKCCIL